MAWIVEKKGKWLVRWLEPGRKTRSKMCRTKDEALALKVQKDGAAEVRRVLDPSFRAPWELGGGIAAADERYSVERYARTMALANRRLRDTTRALYLRTLRCHVDGTPLGQADVRYVGPQDLTDWWAALKAGPGALRNAQQLVSTTLRHAVQAGLREDNPLDRAPDVRKPPGRVRRDVRPLRTEEVEALADAAVTPRDRMEVLVMAYGGLRAGEVGGLRVEDVNFERGQVHLRQQVVRVSGEGLRTTDLKTDAARRVVTLPRSVVDELREFLTGNPPAPDGRMFHGLNDGMRDSVRINASVQRAAGVAGLRTHPHALRHTAVSLWIDDGASPIDVQHMVGHADIRMTLGTYGHLFSYGGEALAKSMEQRRERHRNGSP